MVNYNPVVQSIVGMGKVEEPEYVDTRVNMDLSSLGKLAEQQTQGLMSAARFEREMYSAIDKANRQKKADQYAALKEQRAAEKHQWAAEKHQFAINAEERAQTKFNIEQAQKGLLLNFANDATELARSAEYTGASIYERNAQLTSLMDKYTPAGIDPIQMTKVANNLFGNIGSDLNQIMVNRENRLNESEEKAAERFVESGDFPEESKVLMSTRDKLNLWNNTRNVQGNLQSAIGMLDSIKESGIDPNLAIDTFKKAGGEATKLASYMSVAQQIQTNPLPMTPEQKEQARMWYTNMLIEQSGGTLSRGEARAVVNASTTFFDLPLDVQKNLIKSIGKESTIKIAGSGEALAAMYYLNGEKGVQDALLQSGLPGMELISNLGSNLGKASNGTITMPDGSTQTVDYFTQGWWNSLNTQQQQQLAPLVANMATNGNNTPDTRTSTAGVILSEAGKIIDNLVTRDTSDLQNAINDEDISKVNVGGNIDAAISYIDKNEETWKKASTVAKRDMTGQIQSLTYKTISLVANSLSEYGFGTYIVYDPETNQLYPTKDMTDVSTLDAIARTGGQAWRMELIDQANEMLKRVYRFSIDEKETKAFIKNTLADNNIEIYDKNKHVIENPNYITKLWRGVGRAVPDTVNTVRTIGTAVKEFAQNGKVSEATSAQLYADFRRLHKTGENFEEFIKDQVEKAVEGGLEIKDGVVSLARAISETDTFKQYSKVVGEKYEAAKEKLLNLFGGDTEAVEEETEAVEDDFVEPTVEQQQQRQEQLEEISDTTEELMPWDERVSSIEEVNRSLEENGVKYSTNNTNYENTEREYIGDLPANPWLKESENEVNISNPTKPLEVEKTDSLNDVKDPDLQTLENIKTIEKTVGGGVATVAGVVGVKQGIAAAVSKYGNKVKTFWYTKVSPNPGKIAEIPGYTAEQFNAAMNKKKFYDSLSKSFKGVTKGGLKGAGATIVTEIATAAEDNFDKFVKGASRERDATFAAASEKDKRATVQLYRSFAKEAKTEKEKEALKYFGYPEIYTMFIQRPDKDALERLGLNYSPRARTLDELVKCYDDSRSKLWSDFLTGMSITLERRGRSIRNIPKETLKIISNFFADYSPNVYMDSEEMKVLVPNALNK